MSRQFFHIRFVLMTLFFGLHGLLTAQTIQLEGYVLDKTSKEGLPFANVVFSNTTVGTTTDATGKFFLSTSNNQAKSLTVSYLGYETQTIKLKPNVARVVIELNKSKETLKEVEIKAKRRIPKDTAAIALYRKVAKNKEFNRPKEYDYYSYREYGKLQLGLFNVSEKFMEKKFVQRFDVMFRNMDTLKDGTTILPVIIKETVNDVYYRKAPKALKTILVADKFSGIENSSVSDLMDYSFQPINIYDNIISVNSKPFMSPFANNALFSYKYFLKDTAVFDGDTCYQLLFTGKSNADQAFTGFAWIHKATYAIKEIKLEILPSANLNFVTKFISHQSFKYIDRKKWFLEEEHLQTELNLIELGKQDKQSFLIKKDSYRDDIIVDKPIDERVFIGEPRIIEEDARKRDEEFWDSIRVVPLTQKESLIYGTVDSIKSLKIYKFLDYMMGVTVNGFFKVGPVEFGRWYQFFSWNDVEGSRVKLAFKTRKEFSRKLQLGGHGAYGFKDNIWKYGGEAKLHLRRVNEKWHMLSGFHRYDMIKLDQDTDNPILTYDNIGLSILRRDPIDDLHLQRWTQLLYEREWPRGINTNLTFNHKINHSVPTGISFYKPIDALGTAFDTVSTFTTTELDAEFMWGKDRKFFYSNFSRFPVTNDKPELILNYRVGIEGLLGGDFKYHKLEFSLRQKLLGPIGYTVYRIYGGKFFGQAPYTSLEIHKGNESFIYGAKAYNTMKEFEYIGDTYAGIWLVHHFDGLIFNKIPGINKLGIRSLLYYKGLWSQLSEENENTFLLPNNAADLDGFFMEAGVGLENILKFFRIDFMWRITQRSNPDVNKWALKFLIAPNF